MNEIRRAARLFGVHWQRLTPREFHTGVGPPPVTEAIRAKLHARELNIQSYWLDSIGTV